MPRTKGAIAILTGGGDVPGLNPAIRAITIRALREGYRVVGIRRGWAGLVDYVPDKNTDNSENVQELSEATVNRAGRTAATSFPPLRPTIAGAADRCVIPEHPVDVERLTELLAYDRNRNPSRYSVVLVSEGATLKSHDGMSFESEETDMFGHRKLGGIGDAIAAALKEYSPKYNNGRRIDVVNQRLGYLVRSGDPDALDSIVPMVFGNLALDLILKKQYGRLVSIHKGFYDSVPITNVTSEKKVVDVKKYYNTDRLRPIYEFDGAPLFIMTSD